MPLFVEELTKAVLEAGLLRDAGDRYVLAGPLPPLAIPATLQDSLLARLDRLAPVKEVAQIGAVHRPGVLATSCWPPWPRGRPSELRQALARAGRGGAGLPPRRAAGGAVHLQARAGAGRRLPQPAAQPAPAAARAHRRAILEERFPEIGGAQPELLAHHCTEAGWSSEAVEYWQKAGELAHRRARRLRRRSRTSRRRSDLLATLPDTVGPRRRELELQVALGSASRDEGPRLAPGRTGLAASPRAVRRAGRAHPPPPRTPGAMLDLRGARRIRPRP